MTSKQGHEGLRRLKQSKEVIKMILKINEVVQKCNLSRATIYKKVKEGTFPKQIKLSERSSGWLESEVNQWIESRVKEREASQGVA